MGRAIQERNRGKQLRGVEDQARYIDLNPLRAKMLDNPAEYRWSSYGAAMAGDERAMEGLIYVMGLQGNAGQRSAGRQSKTQAQWALENYRMWLYDEGRERPGDDVTGAGAKPGFTPEESHNVRKSGGAIPLGSLLRRRVRHFSQGLIIGSKEFVNDWFGDNRRYFNPNRQRGAYPMKGGQGLCSVRQLQDSKGRAQESSPC